VFTVRGDGRAGDWGSAEPPHRMYMYKGWSVCSFLWFASSVGGGGGGVGGGVQGFDVVLEERSVGGGGLCVCALAHPMLVAGGVGWL